MNFIIFGDFNGILNSSECWGSNGLGSALDKLINFVETLELQDLPLSGSFFTSFSNGPSVARSKLDQFHILAQASNWCHQVTQKVVFKFQSDHIPIVLSGGQVDLGPGHSDFSTCAAKTVSWLT